MYRLELAPRYIVHSYLCWLLLPYHVAGDCNSRPAWEAKLLQLFALAQRIEDAEVLSQYLSAGTAAAAAAALSAEQQAHFQRLEACRIVASLHDGDAIALHNLALKVVKEADTDRWVEGAGLSVVWQWVLSALQMWCRHCMCMCMSMPGTV